MKKILTALLAVGLLRGYAGATLGVSVNPTSLALGTFGAGYFTQTTFTVTNTGSFYEQIYANGNNSANWTLVTGDPGANQFRISLNGGSLVGWQDLTTTAMVIHGGLADVSGNAAIFNMRFYGPMSDTSGVSQSIALTFRAAAETAYQYNQAGDFYWRDVGTLNNPTLSNWAISPSESILPMWTWRFMTGTTVGWMTSSTTSGMLPAINFASWGVIGQALAMSPTGPASGVCPICGRALATFSNSSGSASWVSTVSGGLGVSAQAQPIIDSNLNSTVLWENQSFSIFNPSFTVNQSASFTGCSFDFVYSAVATAGTSSTTYYNFGNTTSNRTVSSVPQAFSRIVILN